MELELIDVEQQLSFPEFTVMQKGGDGLQNGSKKGETKMQCHQADQTAST